MALSVARKELAYDGPEPDWVFVLDAEKLGGIRPGETAAIDAWIEERMEEARQKVPEAERADVNFHITRHYGRQMAVVLGYRTSARSNPPKRTIVRLTDADTAKPR